MAEYVTVREARAMSGLRIVGTVGAPGVWSEATKGLFQAKGVPFTLVEMFPGQANEDLVAWTAQNSAPVAIWNDERPRTTWFETIWLAERIAPEVPLVPADLDERALMFGLTAEIAGERGFGWNSRLIGMHNDRDGTMRARMAPKYGYDPAWIEPARAQMAAIVARLRRQLEAQQAMGREYLIGTHLTALDIYWAAFAIMIEPMPMELCALPEYLRGRFGNPALRELAGEALMAHRDTVYRRHLTLPMDF